MASLPRVLFRSPIEGRSATSLRISTVADAWIQPGVEQVHHQVDEHENRDHDHDQRLGHFVILIENRFQQQPGETIEVEYLFSDN